MKDDDGDGFRLVVDEDETAPVLREIVRRIIDGESANSVVRWLNNSSVPTALDAQRLRAGNPVDKPSEWRVGNLLKMLRSVTMLGQAERTEEMTDANGRTVKKSKVILGPDSAPLQRAEPIVSREDYSRLQAALDARGGKKTGERANTSSLLLRVAYCACGEPMYTVKGRTHVYYRCSLRSRASRMCDFGSNSIRADLLEETVTETFLLLVGGLEMQRQVLVPGSGHLEELAATEKTLADILSDREAGLYSSERGKKEFQTMYRRLDARREALAGLPVEQDTWRSEPTGQTYQEHWDSLGGPAERAKALRDAGIRATVKADGMAIRTPGLIEDAPPLDGYGRIAFQMPTDLRERLGLPSAQTRGQA